MQDDMDRLLARLGRNPVAAVFESPHGAEKAIECAKRIAKGSDAIAIIREDRALEKRLLPAYLSAYLRCMENGMHSGSLSLETILFVAGDMNITNATDTVGAAGSRFIVFSSSKALSDRLARECRLKKARDIRLSFDHDAAGDVAMTAISGYK